MSKVPLDIHRMVARLGIGGLGNIAPTTELSPIFPRCLVHMQVCVPPVGVVYVVPSVPAKHQSHEDQQTDDATNFAAQALRQTPLG